ncbi:hypothetical protein JW698_00445 [Candidatus Wolfebacteria bacterium]|nr:hypothetical protein [Candidatus Wolfebacteria bacterium]
MESGQMINKDAKGVYFTNLSSLKSGFFRFKGKGEVFLAFTFYLSETKYFPVLSSGIISNYPVSFEELKQRFNENGNIEVLSKKSLSIESVRWAKQ